MTNLVSNAAKFTVAGHVTLSVQTTALDDDRVEVQIRVEDTGIGIPEAALASLFDAFTQADVSTTRRFGGTGLGLHITRELVRRMGGRIDVESEVGAGTTFTVRFAAPIGEELTPTPARGQELRQLGLRVLVAEDNIVNRAIIERMLDLIGCTFVCVADGQAAVDAVLELPSGRVPFDCVLMDCEMPIMDGYKATERLRELGATLPIVALTAHSSGGGREKCLAAGMTDMLSKPITIELLCETLSRLCEPAASATASPTSRR
ncbi:MAG TPA: response regulator, partial [Polyangiaceae bacterium]|nr:response regulator [Polyangiaceae bacterium]